MEMIWRTRNPREATGRKLKAVAERVGCCQPRSIAHHDHSGHAFEGRRHPTFSQRDGANRRRNAQRAETHAAQTEFSRQRAGARHHGERGRHFWRAQTLFLSRWCANTLRRRPARGRATRKPFIAQTARPDVRGAPLVRDGERGRPFKRPVKKKPGKPRGKN